MVASFTLAAAAPYAELHHGVDSLLASDVLWRFAGLKTRALFST